MYNNYNNLLIYMFILASLTHHKGQEDFGS